MSPLLQPAYVVLGVLVLLIAVLSIMICIVLLACVGYLGFEVREYLKRKAEDPGNREGYDLLVEAETWETTMSLE
jgi:hypothetical protein